jgi:hypothetical protein
VTAAYLLLTAHDFRPENHFQRHMRMREIEQEGSG